MARPTVDELQALLQSDDGPPVRIMPDGSVRELRPTASGFEEVLTKTPAGPWQSPTPEMLISPEFNAVWQRIKHWDINTGDGPSGATGNHVRAILDALAAIEPTALELGKAARAVR